jgi:hypothetical protein
VGSLLLIGLGCIIYLLAALNGNIDADEFQFMANGWDIFRGLTPFRDFWDNHGLIANYLFAAPFLCWPATHEILYLFRLAACTLTLLCVALTGVAARSVFPHIPWAGRLSAALLLACSLYQSNAHEGRSDVMLTLVWIAGLALCAWGLRKKRDWPLFAAGFACGAGLWFTPKGLVAIAGGGLVLLSDAAARRRLRLSGFALFGAGAAVAAGILAASLLWLGVWYDCLKLTFLDPMKCLGKVSVSPFISTVEEYPWWMGLTLACIGVAVWRLIGRRRLRIGECWLWPLAAFLLIYYFLLLPIRYSESLMPLHPVVAILGAALLHDVVGAARKLRCFRRPTLLWLVLLGGIGIGMTWNLASTTEVLGNMELRLRTSNRLATLVPPGEFVLSGEGPPVCRPAPLPAHVLVTYMRELYDRGAAPFDIPSSLQERAVRFISFDPRLGRLPKRDLQFFRTNYLHVADTRAGRWRVLLAAGKIVALNDQRSTVSIAIARHYWVRTLPDADMPLKIDGHETSCAAYLSAGEHVLERADRPTTVVLSSIWPRRLDWKVIRAGRDSVPRAE